MPNVLNPYPSELPEVNLQALMGWILGSSVDNAPDWFINGGPQGKRTVLNTSERIITRALNQLDTDTKNALIATDGFDARFSRVIGNEAGGDQEAFDLLGSNLLQAILTTKTSLKTLEENQMVSLSNEAIEGVFNGVINEDIIENGETTSLSEVLTKTGVEFLLRLIINLVNTNIANTIVTSIDDTSVDEKVPSAKAVQTALLNMVANLNHLQFEKAPTLPDSGETNIIYLVETAAEDDARLEMFIFANGEWFDLGPMKVNMELYWAKEELVEATNEDIEAMFNRVMYS
jgi:hypothetical protein